MFQSDWNIPTTRVFLRQVSRPTPCLFLRWASRPSSRVFLLQGGPGQHPVCSQPISCLFLDRSMPRLVLSLFLGGQTPPLRLGQPTPLLFLGRPTPPLSLGWPTPLPVPNQPIIPIWIIFLLDLPAAFSHFVLLCQLLCPPPMSLLKSPYESIRGCYKVM